VTLYPYRVAAEARQTVSALPAIELSLARAQHLSQRQAKGSMKICACWSSRWSDAALFYRSYPLPPS
jgi:hypothetical protein